MHFLAFEPFLQFFEHFFELFFRNGKLRIYSGSLVIYSLYRVVQKFGNLCAFSDSEFYHCEYPQLRVEFFILLENYVKLRFQEGVEVFDESRENIQKCGVETVVHMPELVVCNVTGRIRKLDYIVCVATPEARVYASAESKKPVDVRGVELEETGDVAVGNPVGALQAASEDSAFPYECDHIAQGSYKKYGKHRKQRQTQCKLSFCSKICCRSNLSVSTITSIPKILRVLERNFIIEE